MKSEYRNFDILSLYHTKKFSHRVAKAYQYEVRGSCLYPMVRYNKRFKELYVGEHEYHNVPLGWLKENISKCTFLLVWDRGGWE